MNQTQYRARPIAIGAILKIVLTILFLVLPLHAFGGFVLIERAPCGFFSCDEFVSVTVEWSDRSGNTVARTTKGGGDPFRVATFRTREIEEDLGLTPGTIVDWKQTRVMESGNESTLSGKFARRNSPLEIISYEDAYIDLGLKPSDAFFLPDFAADLDGDGLSETELFSALNLFSEGMRFLNQRDYSFDVPFLVSDFPEITFSLTDSIFFDPLDPGSGFTTPDPAPPGLQIVADAEHITFMVPEPPVLVLMAAGVLLLAWRNTRNT